MERNIHFFKLPSAICCATKVFLLSILRAWPWGWPALSSDNFTVTGIIKDLPNNTRFKFDYLLPWSYLTYRKEDDISWGNNSTRTYVLLKLNARYASVAPKMQVLKQKYDEEAKKDKWEMFLYPASRWRLYSSFTNGVEDSGTYSMMGICCSLPSVCCHCVVNRKFSGDESSKGQPG